MSYRLSGRLGRCPTDMRFEDLDATLIGDFLAYLEIERGNSVRSRNTRLAAIRSFYRFTSIREPQFVHHCQRVLSIPVKKLEKRTVTYLNPAEMEVLLSAPDTTTWFGRRARTLLVVALQTAYEKLAELRNARLSHSAVIHNWTLAAPRRCAPRGLNFDLNRFNFIWNTYPIGK